MTDVLPRNAPVPVVGPIHIPAVSWFEFVLDDKLLGKHLSGINPDPSAGQLICDFLLQANRQISQLQAIHQSSLTNGDANAPSTNIKIQTLKLLAIKVAAFLKWDLNFIEKCVPNGIVQALLVELLGTTGAGDPARAPLHPDDAGRLPDQAVFAIQLYHRWCLRTIVRHSFTSKPNVKTGFISAPDFGSHHMYGDNLKPVLYNELVEREATSVSVLENCLQCGRSLVVPAERSIGVATENTETIVHRWDLGLNVAADELAYQIAYDLGAFFFYKENYTKALEMFTMVKTLHNALTTVTMYRVDVTRLNGYYIAATNLLNVDGHRSPTSIRDRIEQSKRNNYQDLCDILLEDNTSHELTLEHRENIEEDVLTTMAQHTDLVFRVRMCTLVRKVSEGKAVLTDLSDDLQTSTNNADFLIEVLRQALSTAPYGQRSNIKCFIWHTVQTLPRESYFTESLLKAGFQSYFDDDDYSELSAWDEESTFVSSFVSCTADATPAHSCKQKDKLMGVGEIERQLLSAYDPDVIKSLVQELCDKWGRKPQQVIKLNDKWKLPRELRFAVESLQISPVQAYVYILIAKARHCMEMRIFERSRQLLSAADGAVKDVSYKLVKRIRWQSTLADMKQVFLNDAGATPATRDLCKKAKTCLTALRLNQDIQPSSEILEHCSAFLLNMRDCEYMCNMDNTRNGYIELSRQIAAVCKDLPQMKGARKPARELWDSVLAIFAENGTQQAAQKRTNSARSGARDSPKPQSLLSQDAFVAFITKLREPITLSMLISCITKFYNLIRDDITNEIFSEYINLWPSNLNSGVSANIPAVADALATLIQHAIQMHPTQSSWLHTQADIFFVHDRHAPAMKFYLESGVVATDFFCEPVTRAVYDDQVFHRMIKCCSYLQCHTQVAVLCQLLEDVDYLTCFKALQQRKTCDAMDTYYAYIWDVSILEFLVHLHTKRGELEKKQAAMRALSQLDLNSNNPDDILIQAVNSRKRKFLQALAKQYL